MIKLSRILILIFSTVFLSAPSGVAWSLEDILPRADASRMEARIVALSEFGKNADGGVDRVAYSAADIAGRAYIIEEMKSLGLMVSVDTAGNILGLRAGSDPSLKTIMFGSHIDSVPGGGNYDGDVGVIASLEVIELLNQAGITTRHPLEVVVFSNEEGGLVGSLGMTGKIKPDALKIISASGLIIADGIDAIGGDSANLAAAVRAPDSLAAFFELHIEQGAILDEESLEIGVVEGIVGILWWDVVIEGFANHAGTTPMDRRQDAMLAAARLTIAINEVATSMEGRQVATVGRIHAEPGAPNVIPGRVILSLEIRDLDAGKMDQVFAEIEARAASIAEQSGTDISFHVIDVASDPTPTDPHMRQIIAAAAAELGLSTKIMPSGAGHDAQDMATIVPTGMIFVPSVGGVSHSPKEFTRAQDMANGADVLLRSILAVDTMD